jgi:hypothetical protein
MSRSANTSPVGPMRGELLLDRDHALRDRELVADQSVARGRRRAQSGVDPVGVVTSGRWG